MPIQTHTCTYIHMYVCVCIVCISVYCMNMCVLYVLLVYTCIACICMDGLYCVYSVYLHVSACIVCIRNFVCMCMYCLYMSVYLKTFFQIHTHTCTYIHTYNTYKIQICCKCMYVYVFSGKYIHHTDSRFHIQTNTNMQVPWWPCPVLIKAFVWESLLQLKLLSPLMASQTSISTWNLRLSSK